ncbi:NADH-quinone oxidoreductase subunit A [Buchnera aphidicola (Sipha maydis)]|nr:NADH-quinone oxidoreductase subunit A [Buchnera aphidicola]USS94425.1 NADH-quinone oxidoreductase subunit A [Buchnera aphidicola (Sipha maydis)]WII23866.1 NADH-quinone oxidoreductase subunit A [Buchnera aphidicola (Sipha maydis)]
MIEYSGVISFVLFIIFFCCIVLFLSYILGGRSSSDIKEIPFESGAPSTGNTNLRFSVKFYLIAMFFVIFDIEAMYLYSWAVCVKETGWFGFTEVSLFIFMILLSLLYLYRIQALSWVSEKK